MACLMNFHVQTLIGYAWERKHMKMNKESSLSGNIESLDLRTQWGENDFIDHKKMFQIRLPFQSTSQVK